MQKLSKNQKINHLPERETDLLQKIHHNIPLDVRLRHRLLSKKLDEEAITNEEYSELKSVVTRIEKANVERLQALIELAQLRGISLDDLVEQLDLEYEEA
jgi:hypothetical protein